LAADPSVSSVLDLSPSPSTAVALRAEHRVLLEALRSIPLELQIALELHYWESLSASEVAEILELPSGTAKSRLRRAREALLTRIGELEGDPERLRTTELNLDAWAASLRDAVLADRPTFELD
jgi:RNA polymerase sigma-70 factor (ECF subfamily)